ncbi:hypothetical protein [Candidatus Rhabdochlamydia porcellionis]|jgi:hypothetical protein|uniref:Chromosome partition protein Smc n=1 Tax=Candidatus Rhabdochlamydia porcellionis TaxID=225148 RepID=A0ABX8Z1F9_9BACT|nr:hypothetical protein [Candidatus Rhabdochlamydia porcellionis]QZA58397.1 Chromosome partition protein Smc [Candidatus Rhabdochlamydia porcellionis]
MLTQELHSSSTSLIQYDSQSFSQKINKHSLAYTVKKTAAVSCMILGGAFLLTGVTLVGIVTGGLAIPIAAPFVLGSLGAAGITGGGCVLGSMKVNRAAQKVLVAAHLIEQETENLEQQLKEQGPIVASLAEKLENLQIQAESLEKILDQGDQELEEADQKIEQTKKQKKEFEKGLNKIQSLTHSLNETLTKLQNIPTSDKELKTLEKQIDKMTKKLDQLNENVLRIEPSLKEHNKELQQLKKNLIYLQGIKLSLEQPSTELEKIAYSIRSKNKRPG